MIMHDFIGTKYTKPSRKIQFMPEAGLSWLLAGRPTWISNKKVFKLVFGTRLLVDGQMTSLD